MLRMMMGVLAAWSQSHFLDSISSAFGKELAKLTCIILAGSTGMFIASTAFLPNTISMILLTFIWSQWLRGQDNKAILLSVLMTVIGWPYAIIAAAIPCLISIKPSYAMSDGKRIESTVLSLRVKIELLLRRLILGALFSLIYILLPSLGIERYYYGRWTLPSLNAVIYNVLSASGGPEIFGVEPWHYYPLNLLLNFSLFLPASLLSILLLPFDSSKVKLGLLFANMILPMAIFTRQAHKEERFLFIVYPLICFFAAYTFSWIQKQSRLLRPLLNLVIMAGITVSGLRSFGLVQFYRAPEVLLSKWRPAEGGKLCMAANWYRFPGSFYLPDNVRLGFLEGAVAHLQPTYFADTKEEQANVNQLNRPIKEQYTSIDQCSWFMGTRDELSKKRMATPLSCEPLLNSGTRAPYRWLWIPFITTGKAKWDSMCIYQLSDGHDDVIIHGSPRP
jgi:alpha-1,2-mannosyltransferase